MNVILERVAITADFAVQAKKETEVFLVKEMGISLCVYSTGWCQEQQKIFNSWKTFEESMNLLYWIKSGK